MAVFAPLSGQEFAIGLFAYTADGWSGRASRLPSQAALSRRYLLQVENLCWPNVQNASERKKLRLWAT
jgi:hypothetical protein